MPPDQDALHTVNAHNDAWRRGDVDQVLALYHPDMVFYDHAASTRHEGPALREHVRSVIQRSSLHTLVYLDRPRVEGDTVFLRYRETVRAPEGDEWLSLSACDCVRVSDGQIVEIHEYAVLQHTSAGRQNNPHRHEASRIGLSPRAMGFLLRDLQTYFDQGQAFLQPGLSLNQVASDTGYTRNQISYALNHALDQTFYRYLGRARVQHALRNPQLFRQQSIADLALALGFRSVTGLYRSFRDATGLTPRQWQEGAPEATTPDRERDSQ
ncbi:nuclear transport factor 2 family protein [Hydrogenophaga sp.]|uniref:nuclear transport factor 2 family protein n=1 Tax=Hydrogenophaga sp. TaxID=1904254 RepID=UPI0025BAF98E|nr:nuclear transport factor 2 family protein [Hydrogenophaga sp.]